MPKKSPKSNNDELIFILSFPKTNRQTAMTESVLTSLINSCFHYNKKAYNILYPFYIICKNEIENDR